MIKYLDLSDLVFPIIVISLCFIGIIAFYFNSKKDFEFWQRNKNIIVFSDCYYHDHVYYCVSDSEVK